MSPNEALKAIQEALEAEGYLISVAELANFFLAMTVSPLVILSGISGTGKSLLPRKFAKRTNSKFHPIPVQPQWSDNSDLFGFVPTLSPTKFVEGKLIKALRDAHDHPNTLVIALLDEMNLAPVEHYFSDFLSVAESRERKGAMIGSDPLPIELPAVPGAGLTDPEADLRGIELPSNLRVIGTANMDETTHSFSPKVLDRAFTIEFDDPDLTSFASGTAAGTATFEVLSNIVIDPSNAISVLEARTVNQDLFEHIAQRLSEIQDILSPAGIKFGYRTRDAILLYLHFWRQLGLSDIMAGYAALDFCILQKVLPKVSGSGEVLAEALSKLAAWLQASADTTAAASGIASEFAGPLERSHQKISRMSEILKLDGSTRYWVPKCRCFFKHPERAGSSEIIGKRPELPAFISNAPESAIIAVGVDAMERHDAKVNRMLPVAAGDLIEPLFFEAVAYDIHFEKLDPSATLILPPGAEARRVRADSEHHHLNFGNNVGFADIGIRTVSGSAKLRLEVFSRKADYRTDYVAMRDEVSAMLRNLAMAANAKTFGLAAPAKDHYPTLVEWFALLQGHFDEFMRLTNGITKNPHSGLVRKSVSVDTERARRVSRQMISRALRRQNSGAAIPSLGVALPRKIHESVSSPTFDTPENRYFKALIKATYRNIRALRA